VGDVLKTKRKDITLEQSFDTTGAIKVLFCRGKGARFKQPYTVPTTCLREWRPLLRQYLDALSPEDWVFPGGTRTYGPLTSIALRSANANFTVRALRRGALQAMAIQGVDFATLRLFSGHTNDDTLKRYLDWGAMAGLMAQQARGAARHLAG
jgi:hypothetical protein